MAAFRAMFFATISLWQSLQRFCFGTTRNVSVIFRRAFCLCCLIHTESTKTIPALEPMGTIIYTSGFSSFNRVYVRKSSSSVLEIDKERYPHCKLPI